MIKHLFISTNFKRLYTSLLYIVLLSAAANGQNSNNPFEIKNRIENNPFVEQKTSSAKIVGQNQDSSVLLLPRLEIQKLVATEISKPSFQLENDKNPFEVNHIPLRRKDVLKNTPIENKKESISKPPSKSFIYWMTILSLIFLALATTSDTKLLAKVTKSIFNENILKLEHRNKTILSLEYILLYSIFIINASIFALLLLHHYGDQEINFLTFAKCVGLISFIYTIKHISNYLFGLIFSFEKETSLYSFTIQVFNAFIGIVLIPINLFLAFGPDKITDFTILFGLCIVSILLVIRYMRGFTISINYIFNNLILFFIYLCTLEIAPILILVKVFSKY